MYTKLLAAEAITGQNVGSLWTPLPAFIQLQRGSRYLTGLQLLPGVQRFTLTQAQANYQRSLATVERRWNALQAGLGSQFGRGQAAKLRRKSSTGIIVGRRTPGESPDHYSYARAYSDSTGWCCYSDPGISTATLQGLAPFALRRVR